MTVPDTRRVYLVNWDNGNGACGTFHYEFATEEDAEAFGREWAKEANLRDFGTEDPEDADPYTYDVIFRDVTSPAVGEDEEQWWSEKDERSWRP